MGHLGGILDSFLGDLEAAGGLVGGNYDVLVSWEGTRASQKYDADKRHFAVDIALKENAPIMAVAYGTVIFSEWTAETGHVIIVKHDYGLLSVYKHNSSLEKYQGDLVRAGEVIAKAGDTGELSTGWHLHFELWINGFSADPTDFIDFSQAL